MTENKAALRKEMLSRREALGEDLRSVLSRRVLGKVRDLPSYQRAGTVLAYAGFGDELETEDFLSAVLGEGKRLILPRVNRAKGALGLHEVKRLQEDLEAGVWGIREPGLDLPLVELDEVDFALVPGSAFDKRGGRLGYGGGFYDRLMGGRSKRPELVAGAFGIQMVEEVPVGEHDVFMDLIITESSTYPS
jgi:5-formyltetrahydrofolate cyclo-ligase